MSITDELREWAKMLTHWWYDPVKDEYTYTTGTMPPSIDAVRLDSNIIAIADRIDAEHKKACDDAWDNGYEADYLGIEKWLTEHPQAMEHHGCIRLPKDADGEYIHVGDVMEWPTTGETFEVVGIGEGTLFYVEDGSECADWTGASTKRHHHAPTVEDVLREMLDAWGELPSNATNEAIVAEYASKLRLAEGEDA